MNVLRNYSDIENFWHFNPLLLPGFSDNKFPHLDIEFANTILAGDTTELCNSVNKGIMNCLKDASSISWPVIKKLPEVLGPEVSSLLCGNKKLNSGFHRLLISKGLYRDISIINSIAKDKEYDEKLRVYCAQYCSTNVLRLLIKDDVFEIRQIAYHRLGPVDCYKDMSEDSKYKIRRIGATFAPVSSKEIEKMATDISISVIRVAIQKCSRERLLFLLANEKIIKHKELYNVMKRRLLNDI